MLNDLREVRVRDFEYGLLNQLSLAAWLEDHQRRVVFNQVSWMGVPTLKNVLDLWIYQEIVVELRPDLIIEMGSFQGGSTLYLAHLLELLGHGRVVSVDLDHSRFVADHPRITTLTGSTQSPAVADCLRREAAAGSVLIIHDADHSYQAVLADLCLYADLVTKGSYFIVEDGVVDLFGEDSLLGSTMGGPGPLPAIREFLAKDRRFEADPRKERYLLTYNPRGYLKKIAD
ncbi:MAG: class I SAM-dependent methyltransferase [Deltaproteobacteria bacterium]|nr:class I SAM-dependent methyltransferase [Deltaproteobacteria bacterium]